MAVYERTYSRYRGELTPRRRRFLVVRRYAAREVFTSKLVTGYFALCFAVPLGAAVYLYLTHNLEALALLDLELTRMLVVDATFFAWILRFQAVLAFLLTALVGPGLIAPDLAHDALPLYLARPLSRAEYLLGKGTVLAGVLSLVTWVPALALFLLQAQLAGGGWLGENLRIAGALFAGSWVWIAVVTLLALALSAWVRWRTAAAALLFVLYVIGEPLAAVIQRLFDTHWGSLLSLRQLMRTVWDQLFFGAPATAQATLPPAAAWGALAALAVACLLLLALKIRPREVVR